MQLLEYSDQLWQELETLRKDLESNASSKTFRQVLTQLDVAGRKFSQLQKELRPQLQYYVSHPMYITDHHAQGMSIINIVTTSCLPSCFSMLVDKGGSGATVHVHHVKFKSRYIMLVKRQWSQETCVLPFG